MKFSVYLPTHNRPGLLRQCLISLTNQTHTDFEVLVHDNGSSPSAEPVVAEFKDSRFRFTRSEPASDPCDNGEAGLSRSTGDVFLFLSDDDALVPAAFQRVAAILESDPAVEFLSTGLAYYDHVAHRGELRRSHSGALLTLNGPEQALGYGNGRTAIGAKREISLAPEAHPSGIFIRTDLLRRTRARQGRIFVKPFGDVGFLGCLMDIGVCHHLDVPLAVIGDSLVRETAGARKGQRHRLDKYRPDLEVSPFRAITFINLALESHLKVFKPRSRASSIDLRLRPQFFLIHMAEIAGDAPWDGKTLVDLLECLPAFLRSIVQFASVREAKNLVKRSAPVRLLMRLLRPNPTSSGVVVSSLAASAEYQNISAYAMSISLLNGAKHR